MLDTLTSHRDADNFNTVPGGWPDPGGFLPEARTGAREAAARMKDLAERFAELRNAIMRLPGNPSRGERAGLRHRLLHLENMLMSARGSLDDTVIAIMDANDAANAGGTGACGRGRSTLRGVALGGGGVPCPGGFPEVAARQEPEQAEGGGRGDAGSPPHGEGRAFPCRRK